MEIKNDFDGSINSIFRESILIVLLVDQTGSTALSACNQQNSICELITNSVNSLIMNLILSNLGSLGTIKNRVFISIIGYGGVGVNSAEIIRSGSLSAFADSPLRTKKLKKKVNDGAGGLVEIEEEIAIWLEEKLYATSPENCNFLVKHLNLWHKEKDINYPESFIIHFCEYEKDGFRVMLNSFQWFNEPYKKPILIEKTFK